MLSKILKKVTFIGAAAVMLALLTVGGIFTTVYASTQPYIEENWGGVIVHIYQRPDIEIIINGRNIQQNNDIGFVQIVIDSRTGRIRHDDRTFVPIDLVAEPMRFFWNQISRQNIVLHGHGQSVNHIIGTFTATDRLAPEGTSRADLEVARVR